MSGSLYCVAIHIGNARDITLRALDVLKSVEVIACEDTRSARSLLDELGVKVPRLVSCFEHNESRRVGELLSVLAGGSDVALISEAGTPTISDPGYRLVSACVNAGIHVVPIPGACAALAALSASGLPTDRFLFLGFPPKRGAKLGRFLSRAAEADCTVVLYVPGRRLGEILALLEPAMGTCAAVVCRELTKDFEEFIRGSVSQVKSVVESRDVIRGEVTLVVSRVSGEEDEDGLGS